MPSVQRFLSGHNNHARTAPVAASSVRASTAIERTRAQRSGGGRVRLSGEYTGHEATDIDVEVVAAGGIPRASVPLFTGVGNGTLTVPTVTAAPLQSLTLTLADLGIPTETARLDVREVQIRARNPGAAGNQIRIEVAPELTRLPTDRALLADWPAGSQLMQGEQWNFGALPLTGTGQLDEESPRIQFGHDPQTYRPYRLYKDGAWQFGLSPAPERAIPKGASVYLIEGGYKVTVRSGATVETFGDTSAGQSEIATFYDLLRALQGSTLVEVAGVIAAERAPGGQAAIDVPLRTAAWLHSLSGRVQLEQVSIPQLAPTQTLTVKCINADVVGSERWSVRGDISGQLPDATTGSIYESAAARFLIPARAAAAAVAGQWSFKYAPVGRQPNEGVPSVCVRPFRLGRSATARTVTFRYQQRPPADCSCSDMPTPRVSLKCLGLGGDSDVDDPEYMSRIRAVYAWREEFIRDNTHLQTPHQEPDTPGTPGTPAHYRFKVNYGGPNYNATLTSTAHYSSYDEAVTARDAVIAAGRLPIGTTKNQNITMGGVTMRATDMQKNGQGITVTEVELNQTGSSMDHLGPGAGTPSRPGARTYLAYLAYQMDLDWMNNTIPILIDALAHVYDKAPALPAWDALWAEVRADLNHLRTLPPEDDLYERYVTSSRRELIEGTTNKYRTVYTYGERSRGNERFLDRYRATVDNILLSVGILPKSSSSSTDAGGCWTDHGGTHWWVDTEGYYLPAFSNKPYISSRRDTETGKPYSTYEFGFGLVVACEDRLREGDTLTIRILSVDVDRPYQEGDEAIIQTVAAGPAWLTGGVDGTDVLTWAVHGSASGALPDYVVPTDGTAAPVYNAAGVQLHMALGGIPFALGDRFTLAIEAGQWRWRRSGGAWSAVADIPAPGPAGHSTATLADGLSVEFHPGPAPSFVPGDAYAFAVHQPWAASHARDAHARAWGWAGDAASLEIDLGAGADVAAIAIARYAFPAGAAATIAIDTGAGWGAEQPLDIGRAVAVLMLPAVVQAQRVRISVTGATGGHIGWAWAGVPLATDHHASTCQRTRRWAATRGDGINPSALYAGCGDAWRLAWQPGDWAASRLLESDAQRLLELLDWSQQHDEPLLFVPHHLHPQDAALVRFGDDALEISDQHEWQPDDAGHRLLAASLQLEPVYS